MPAPPQRPLARVPKLAGPNSQTGLPAMTMAAVSSCCRWLPGQGGLDVGATMSRRGEQADDEREAYGIGAPSLVQEILVRRDDDVHALQRLAGDGPRVRAVRDRDLGAAGGTVEELPGITHG